jgi:thiamine-monophosphate kinase
MTSEFAWIDRLRDRFPAIGDDCAVVDAPTGSLLLATDALVEGVDFTSSTPLADVGWKAVVANVSDVAAMGGEPRWLVVAVCAPAGTDLDQIASGAAAAAGEHGCEIVGGDLSATGGPLVVSVAITGSVDGGEAVLRTGARAGDTIWVTGALGAAAASRYTRRPRARVAEGVAARRAGATAMIDVSDGLVADLHHLTRASGVGAALDHVPVADGATLEHALGGGEDFELIFTMPAEVSVPGAIRMGTCTADPAEQSLGGDPLPPAPGFEHRF